MRTMHGQGAGLGAVAAEGHPRRDRRRLRRQDRHLPRAARRGAVAEGRPPGEDRDDPRRGVPGHRPDLGHAHDALQDRGAKATARSPPPQAWLAYEAGAFPGSPVGAGAMTCARALRASRTSRSRATTSSSNKPQGRGLPRARRADGGVRASRRVVDELAAEARHRPARAPPEERRRRGHAGHLRPEVPRDRLQRDARGHQGPPALPARRSARTRAAASPAASGSTPA